jgi:hypothetical protein
MYGLTVSVPTASYQIGYPTAEEHKVAYMGRLGTQMHIFARRAFELSLSEPHTIPHSKTMSSVPTVYLPLTTTFTAPAKCANTPYIVLNKSTVWWKVGGDTDPSCFPPAFPFSKSSIVYSPGICPAAWSSACHQQITRSGTADKVVFCCPSYVPRP